MQTRSKNKTLYTIIDGSCVINSINCLLTIKIGDDIVKLRGKTNYTSGIQSSKRAEGVILLFLLQTQIQKIKTQPHNTKHNNLY